jgi:hypothetical protein
MEGKMRLVAALACLCLPAAALAQSTLSAADEAAAFRAAGFTRVGGQWKACEDPGTASYTQGAIEQVVDLNGDGLAEAIIAEHSGFCYGMQGSGYFLAGKQPGGTWKLITSGSGMLTPLETKGIGGWQDIEIGGPGFCFAVARWNGTEYRFHRYQYEGKTCNPDE